MVIEKGIFLKTHQLIFSLIESKAFAKGYLVAEIEVFFFFQRLQKIFAFFLPHHLPIHSDRINYIPPLWDANTRTLRSATKLYRTRHETLNILSL